MGQCRFRFLRFDFVRMRNRSRGELLIELFRYRDSEHQLAAYFLCVAKYNSSGGRGLKETVAVFSPA